jgi:predicted peptidase
MPAEPAASIQVLLELLDQVVRDNPVDRKKLHVTGASMGGYGTFDLIERHPELFASAIPVCGGGDPSKAEAIKSLKIWIFHCADDNVVPVKGSREMFDALLKARGEQPATNDGSERILRSSSDGKTRYTEYKNGKHFAWDKAYVEGELLAWMSK